MTALTEPMKKESALQMIAKQGLTAGPQWIGDLKQRAAQRFAALGIPTHRHEDWKYVNLAALRETPFTIMPDVAPGHVTATDVERFMIADLEGPVIVFVDGVFAQSLSRLDDIPDGVRIAPLSQAFETDRPTIAKHLGMYAKYENEAFTALNTACIEDGVFVHVSAHATSDKTIHILSIAANGDTPVVTNPRNLIVAEESSRINILEHYVALEENVYFTNAVTEVVAMPDAVVKHYVLERESEKAFNVSTLVTYQLERSDVDSHTLIFGGAIVRNNINPILDGDDCICLINGMYAPRGKQVIDNLMRVEHNKLRGDSRQFYKGVLLDHGRANFTGRIVVAKGAQQTDAKQTNANLLLSNDAEVNTRPQLEIFADDVKCTHGATIGQLDEDALFYLESRGISKEAARALMVYSFAAESFERMTIEPIRKFLERLLINRLPQGQLLDEVL